MEMILTANMITADEAQHCGLVNHVTSPSELLELANKLASKIAQNSPSAIAHAIASVNAGSADKSGFEAEIKSFGECFATEDFKEGTTAFLEKRKASFTGN